LISRKWYTYPFLFKSYDVARNTPSLELRKSSAYLLKKGKSNPNFGDKIFFFYSKFRYFKRNLSPEEIEQRIKAYTEHAPREGSQESQSLARSDLEEIDKYYSFSWFFKNSNDGEYPEEYTEPRTIERARSDPSLLVSYISLISMKFAG